jgi:tRNA dimethylallyltransferase
VPAPPAEPETVAIFGPTAAGKTGIAIELAEELRGRGEDPVAVNCDSIQLYQGLGVLSGAASAGERSRLEHRLVGFVPVDQEFSAGRFAALARREIDSLLEQGRRPIVVGGTGLYLRAALSSIELRPPVSGEVRDQVEGELAERGVEALHEEISPALAAGIHPRDRKRVARTLELERSGLQPAPSSEKGGELWTASLRHPTLLAGIVLDPDQLAARIDARVDQMVAEGAAAEARAAERAGASRTASAALGFRELICDDFAAVKALHRRYARRQMTWMRRMEGVRVFDRSDRSDRDLAAGIVAALRGAAL